MKAEYLLPAALLAVLAGCRPAGVRELDCPVVLQAPVSPLPGYFCLDPAAPFLSYVDRDSRSLVLAAVDGSSPPAYLDRITDLPEQDPLAPIAGAHLLFAAGDELHLLYLDRQSEESLVLKYVRRSLSAGTTWLDLLPGSGRPLAAFPSAEGLEVFLERDQTLLREGPRPQTVRTPFRSEGQAHLFAAEGLRGFTVYDGQAHRLLLFLLRGREVESLEVARFGQAQDSAVDEQGRLQILTYDPRSFRILLYRTEDPASGFQVQPVTLSRGTTSVALVRLPGGQGFLFNEISARQHSRYQVSLLSFLPAEGYQKTVLYRSDHPVIALRAVPAGEALYVALLQENLRVLRVDYGALR
jgi:hypothetical protein